MFRLATCRDQIRRDLALPCSPNINNNVQSANNRIILDSVILHATWQSWMICATSIPNEFAKSGHDQTQSGFPQFMMENGWLKLDFVWRIWKIWTGLDTIRVFQISYRQWLAKGWFSVANFGKFTFERKFPKFSYQSNISFYFYLTFPLTPTSEWQNVVRHKKITTALDST